MDEKISITDRLDLLRRKQDEQMHRQGLKFLMTGPDGIAFHNGETAAEFSANSATVRLIPIWKRFNASHNL